MDEQKIMEVSSVLCGLKRHEWGRIKAVIEKQYDSASNKIALEDTESIARNLRLEFHGTIQRLSES